MTKQSIDLRLIADQVKTLLAGRRFSPTPADVEVIHADDGTPSLGIPLSHNDTLIVTPSLDDPARFAVIHNSGITGTVVEATSCSTEEVVEFVRNSI